MALNNESIGISAEVAIAESFGVYINADYKNRAENHIVQLLLQNNNIRQIFKTSGIPAPKRHVAEGQNPVDFILENGQTLSVKTNQHNIGRAAPQNIGQPTPRTYFEYIQKNNIVPKFNIHTYLKNFDLQDTYEGRSYIFKHLSIKYIDTIINEYWKNLFECDYLVMFFNLETKANPLANYKVFGKMATPPAWRKELFSFTQTVESWRESNTLKYNDISIGNFQVHRNRECFKFRFDMKGIMSLLDQNLI